MVYVIVLINSCSDIVMWPSLFIIFLFFIIRCISHMKVLMTMLMFQVRTIIRNSFKDALDKNDILISPAAPSVAYKIGMVPSP